MAKLTKSIHDKPFWKKPLSTLSQEQWEALCDGCGKCCLMKFQDDDTDEVIFTDVACKLLDINTCRCKDYENRTDVIKDCVRITPDNLDDVLTWLPSTCSYKLRAQNLPLPKWHHLISHQKTAIHQKRQSVKFFAQPPESVNLKKLEEDIERHVVYFD